MENNENQYSKIVKHYEKCFEKYGADHRGVDWPNQYDLDKRFQVMTGLILRKDTPCTLLDFGCGTGLLLDWLKKNELLHRFDYYGCDISEKFIECCKKKFPTDQFFQTDVLQSPEKLNNYDYIIVNGVFTMKVDLSYQAMWDFFCQSVTQLFSKANKGIAFNLMSKQVDWERPDLFHVGLDQLTAFLTKNLSRHFVIRNDYGLYEYTAYLYKEAVVK